MLSEGRMRRASLRHRAFDPWPRAAQPWTTQDADAMWSGKTSAYLLKADVVVLISLCTTNFLIFIPAPKIIF